jgi:hypothetical protein
MKKNAAVPITSKTVAAAIIHHGTFRVAPAP